MKWEREERHDRVLALADTFLGPGPSHHLQYSSTVKIFQKAERLNVWIITAIEIFDSQQPEREELGHFSFLFGGQDWHWLTYIQYEILNGRAGNLQILEVERRAGHSWQSVKVWGKHSAGISHSRYISLPLSSLKHILNRQPAAIFSLLMAALKHINV